MAHSNIVSRLKQVIQQKLITSQEIINAIENPCMHQENWSPIYLIDSPETSSASFMPSIFGYYKYPTVIDKNVTFICLLVNTIGAQDSPICDASLHIVIFSHKDHIQPPNPLVIDNRNDYLARLIDEQLNGKPLKYDDKNIYIGRFYLSSSVEDAFDKHFLMRHLIYKCSDLNTGFCDDEW